MSEKKIKTSKSIKKEKEIVEEQPQEEEQEEIKVVKKSKKQSTSSSQQQPQQSNQKEEEGAPLIKIRSDAGWLERFFIGVLNPGVPESHKVLLFASFVLLFVWIVFMFTVFGFNYSIHLYIFSGLSIALLALIVW